MRAAPEEPLVEIVREGDFAGVDEQLLRPSARRCTAGGLGRGGRRARGAVARPGAARCAGAARARDPYRWSAPGRLRRDDRELLRSLASQATLALENVELHFQVRRQAVTDELTGLANHGSFQDLLGAEVDQVRRYRHPVGLIMLDIDDFKSVNDTYGHQQGDIVLKQVARVLQENSRDADTPARYGGEEMALILPHTDLEGSFAIAERVRAAIESLHIGRLDGSGHAADHRIARGRRDDRRARRRTSSSPKPTRRCTAPSTKARTASCVALTGTLNVPGGE